MLYYIGQTVRQARKDAGVSQKKVAEHFAKSHTVIGRLERGEGWPKKFDDVIDAYTLETGVSQRELWDRALARWVLDPSRDD